MHRASPSLPLAGSVPTSPPQGRPFQFSLPWRPCHEAKSEPSLALRAAQPYFRSPPNKPFPLAASTGLVAAIPGFLHLYRLQPERAEILQRLAITVGLSYYLKKKREKKNSTQRPTISLPTADCRPRSLIDNGTFVKT